MKGPFLALGIIGILFILSGAVFALQGNGNISGSAMSGNPFWIYTGSGIAVLGLILATIGFYLGSRASTKMQQPADSETKGDFATTSTSSEDKKQQ